MKRINLILPVLRKKSNEIIIPKYIAGNLSKTSTNEDVDHVIEVYVRSRRKIEIIGINLPGGYKIVDVLLRITKNEMQRAITAIKDTINKKNTGFVLEWTTGICTFDEGDLDGIKYDGCVWQGLVKIPEGITTSMLQDHLLDINSRYNARVIEGIEISELIAKD